MKTSLSLFFLVFVGVSLPAQMNVDLALHARDAPDSIEANVEELTAYLLSEAEGDWEKAEVIYQPMALQRKIWRGQSSCIKNHWRTLEKSK